MTRYIVLLPDGAADVPIDELGGKTPLEAADTPNLDRLAAEGVNGLVSTIPGGFAPGSDVANMGILGYDPRRYHTGRAPIEAASLGIEIPNGRIAFRCNLVNIDGGRMADFTAGHITTTEAAELLDLLSPRFRDRGIEFFIGKSYRHILVWDERLLDVACTPPHDITGEPVAGYLPSGGAAVELLAVIDESREILAGAPVNARRAAEGKATANSIWPWGQGTMPLFDRFEKMHGLGGGIVTAVDLLRGIGRLAGLETPDVKGATGYLDTDYEGKVAAALDLLDRKGFAYLHVEAPDEAGHMGDAALKVYALEDFDAKVAGPVIEHAARTGDIRILLLPDHPTPCTIKTHTAEPVPFAVWGSGAPPDGVNRFSEIAARAGTLRFDAPWILLEFFLGKER